MSLTSAWFVCTLDYLELVDWNGRMVREDKRGSIVVAMPSILSQLGISECQWQISDAGHRESVLSSGGDDRFL